MVLGSYNLTELEMLIDEMRYKSYKYYKANNIESYNDIISKIKNNNNYNFLL